jgi:hypothetical protein
MVKVSAKEFPAQACRQSRSAGKRKLDSFEVKHLRLRFLITVSIIRSNGIWAGLNQGLFQEYLRLVDEQHEALYDDGSEDNLERVGEFGTLKVRTGASSRSPAPLTRENPEERLEVELNKERSRTLADFEKVYGGKDEHRQQRFGDQHLPFDPNPPTDAPDFRNLDGSDDRVWQLRDRVRIWMGGRHLGENWCAETLINVIARQENILDKAYLTPIRQPSSDDWEIAWAKRFYTFIDDLKKTFAECDVESALFIPSMIKAWRDEWMESADESFKTHLTIPPPSGIPRWLPDLETDEEYLKAIESEVKREIRNSPLLSLAIGDHWRKLAKKLVPEVKGYVKQIDSERKARKGIKRHKEKPDEVRHIIWAVQYQVMNIDRKQIASQAKSSKEAVRTSVGRILRAIGVPSRGKLDRKKRGEDTIKGARRIAEGSR